MGLKYKNAMPGAGILFCFKQWAVPIIKKLAGTTYYKMPGRNSTVAGFFILTFLLMAG
jgi:hypothetical protein